MTTKLSSTAGGGASPSCFVLAVFKPFVLLISNFYCTCIGLRSVSKRSDVMNRFNRKTACDGDLYALLCKPSSFFATVSNS